MSKPSVYSGISSPIASAPTLVPPPEQSWYQNIFYGNAKTKTTKRAVNIDSKIVSQHSTPTQQVVAQPAPTQPVVTQPVVAQQVVTQPVVAQPVVPAQQVSAQPVPTQQVTKQVGSHQAGSKPSTAKFTEPFNDYTILSFNILYNLLLIILFVFMAVICTNIIMNVVDRKKHAVTSSLPVQTSDNIQFS
jgi:hypothetical protein